MPGPKWIGRLNELTGFLLAFGIAAAANVVAGNLRWRKDITEGRIYTISPGTQKLLRELPRPVTFKFYFSASHEGVPPPIKQYARRVRDLLEEYRRHSGGRVAVEVYDPKPDSYEEEWAQRYGLTAQSLGLPGMGPPFFLGVVASSGTRDVAIPFLAPEMEPRLEYYLTRMAHEVTRTRRPRVGVMSSLPVLGRWAPPYLRGAGTRGWVFAEELRKEYEVVPVDVSAEEIPSDLDALVVIHPKDLSDSTLFALDQFVLRGGHLLAFVDPFCLAEREGQGDEWRGMPASNLNRLTRAWGIEMPALEVVADLKAASPVSFGPQGAERLPTWLSLRRENLDREDIGTQALELVMMPFAGVFRGEPAEGLKLTRLIQTSEDAALMPAFEGASPGIEKMRAARPEGKAALAVRLQGRFKTAFPEGRPRPSGGEESSKEEPSSPTPETLKESVKDGVVVLVGDADLVHDRYALQAINFFGQTFHAPINDNLNFALNMVEQLAGSDALVGLRGRGTTDRPFDRVLELEKKAQQRWQEEELKLLAKLQETQARLNELQRAKSEDQRFILSPEQKQEIENFRAQRFETQQRLKEVRKKLRADIERLGLAVKAINMAAMPCLVAAYGLFHGWRRRRRAVTGA